MGLWVCLKYLLFSKITCGPEKGLVFDRMMIVGWNNLSTFATDTAGKLGVLGHDGDTFGVDGAQVGVFEEPDEVSLRSFLESHDCRGLESEISLLLVTTDLTESYGTRPVPVGFLDTSCGRGRFASCLGGELLAWGLASGGLAGSLLSTGHFEGLLKILPFHDLFIVWPTAFSPGIG